MRRDKGTLVLDIKPTEDRPGKTDSAQRLLPLYPVLIREGLLAYVETVDAGPLFGAVKSAFQNPCRWRDGDS
jgi:hypothetical protein